ncbi:hypothetical protein IW147_005360 [Coemansia sp. RSA 720]|nr:hypothetical protein IW147_005360 [Coemansia sp. RSA 720]
MSNTLQKSKTLWNAEDIARLVHLVSTYKGRKIDWAAIGKDLGRTASSCQNKHGEFHRNHINPTIDHSEAVSHEVQKQYEQQHCVDWTGIAHLLGLTERECLEANQFNTGKARWIYQPDTFSWDMANRMTAFIKDNYPKPLAADYTAVSNYMWIDINDCAKMASLLRGEMVWTAKVIAQVLELREQGMPYKDIAHQLSPALSKAKVIGTYHSRINPQAYTPLSYEEKHRIKEMMNTHAEQMPFTELQALWTDADTCRIQELVQTYYKPGNQRDVLIQAQIAFPNRSQQSIINKVKWILRKWNADDVARLVHLVSTYKGRKIDWAAIGKDLGRMASSCQNKHGELHRNHINPTIDHSEAVSHEVQKQYEQQHCVDWTGIAHLLGLTERECLEANQFNTGKARWIYHPDTFSWDMANRMKTFIKDNYPEPLPVNYTAVSNYMWIVMSDCVKMASLLRGEMVWTAETIAKVVKLRKNGMVYKDIARQLSPVLNKSKIVGAYYGHIKSKVNAPLTCKEKHRIKEMMNTHAEQMPFTELRALVTICDLVFHV